VEGVTEYMESVAVKIGNSKYSILLPHALPDRPNLFYLGYCHGPVGTCRYFYKLLQMTGDQENVEWIKRLTSGLEATGAPEVRTEGYWNTYNLCCGTAGILNLYLGLWAADQKVNGGNAEHYLEMARRAGAVILNGAVREENGDGEGGKTAKWAYALDRVSPDQISTPIGFFDGAAGVGAVLLQLYRAEKGEFHTTRFVDDPFPGSC
jgi:hypothetical protein